MIYVWPRFVTPKRSSVRLLQLRRENIQSFNMLQPPEPSEPVISSYLAKWRMLENYRLQESSLSELFNKFCPQNTSIEHVLLKVSALNDFYSTNIFDTYSVARRIM